MTPEFQALTDEVTQETTLDGSIANLLSGLSAQLAALAKQPTITPAEVNALAQQVQSNIGVLTTAITANTPAATPPPTGAAASQR